MSIIKEIPSTLPVGITRHHKNNKFIGFRARFRSGPGNGKNNEVSKCFTNSAQSVLDRYRKAVEWLQLMKEQVECKVDENTNTVDLSDIDKGNTKVSGLPDNIYENKSHKGEVTGYLVSYYDDSKKRRQKAFTQANTLDDNLKLAIEFRDSKTNYPVKSKQSIGVSGNKEKTREEKDNDRWIRNKKVDTSFTVDHMKKILKSHNIDYDNKWLKKRFITEVNGIHLPRENSKPSIDINTKESIDENINESNTDVTIELEEDIVLENKEKFISIKENKILQINDKQIMCRSSDGYINLTEMATSCGKLFGGWRRTKETEAFLQAISMSMHICIDKILIREQGGGKKRITWGHPLVAINFAQWSDVNFGVQVSKWVFELISTGKVELGKEKSIQEVEDIWKEKCNKLIEDHKKLLLEKDSLLVEKDSLLEEKDVLILEKDDLITSQKHENISMKKSLSRYERAHHYKKFNIKGPVYYVISDPLECKDGCPRRFRFKHGIAGTGHDGTFDSRLQNHRTALPFLQVDFVVMFFNPGAIETHMETVFRDQLNPNSKEWFSDDENFKQKFIDSLKNYLDMYYKGKYEILSEKELQEYNEDAKLTQKDNLHEGDIPILINNDSYNTNTDSYNTTNNTTNNINPVTNNTTNNTTNNITNNIDLSELKSLISELKTIILETLTIKELDIYLTKIKVPKHGKKDKKISKLRDYIRKYNS